MKAPFFSLPDETGTVHTLDQYSGKWIILYFYPKDDTPGCTKEACSFRDALGELQEKNIVVLGVSKDSPASHKKFKEKYHLTFPLLSDTTTETMQAYGSWGVKKFMGRDFTGTLRNTYLINPEGQIIKTYEKVNPSLHLVEIQKDLEELIGSESVII